MFLCLYARVLYMLCTDDVTSGSSRLQDVDADIAALEAMPEPPLQLPVARSVFASDEEEEEERRVLASVLY